MTRGEDLAWAPPVKVRPQPHLIDPLTRRLIYTRAGGSCECCGNGVPQNDFDAHHRKLRSRGGDDSPTNLCVLCRFCHRRVHDRPRKSTEMGFMVPTTGDPATTAILLHGSAYVLLRPDGKGYIDAELGPGPGDAA